MVNLLCHSRLKMDPQRLERSKKNEVLSPQGHLKAPVCAGMFVPASLVVVAIIVNSTLTK